MRFLGPCRAVSWHWRIHPPIEQPSRGAIESPAARDPFAIRVPRDKRECIEQINRQWQQETGISLETTYLKKIVRLHINAYVAQDEKGAIKTKGLFGVDGLKKKAGGRIVSKALVAYFIHGVPVEQSIGQADDIHEFLYSNKSLKMTWGGVRQQKNVRWYVSTQGRPIVNEYPATGTTNQKDSRAQRRACDGLQSYRIPGNAG